MPRVNDHVKLMLIQFKPYKDKAWTSVHCLQTNKFGTFVTFEYVILRKNLIPFLCIRCYMLMWSNTSLILKWSNSFAPHMPFLICWLGPLVHVIICIRHQLNLYILFWVCSSFDSLAYVTMWRTQRLNRYSTKHGFDFFAHNQLQLVFVIIANSLGLIGALVTYPCFLFRCFKWPSLSIIVVMICHHFNSNIEYMTSTICLCNKNFVVCILGWAQTWLNIIK
jgi:hypothetical protein